MDILVKMKFGSQLYGTATAESDTDIKGIFYPTPDQILSCSVPKTETLSKGDDHRKNTVEDTDEQYYSLPYFLHLALQGETVALDMLHAPAKAILQQSRDWMFLQVNRYRFHTKNLKSFVGYAKRQAAKYGIKGSRLDAARTALAFMTTRGEKRVIDVIDDVPINEHSKIYQHQIFGNSSSGTGEVEWVWEVCGKKMTGGTKLSTYIPMMKKFYDAYGERARQAETNDGIDFKAVSHALRAGYQAKHIFTSGDFTYPLPETDFIKKVKLGELNYKKVVAPTLESLMDELDDLSAKSTLPNKPDYDWARQFLKGTNLFTIKWGR